MDFGASSGSNTSDEYLVPGSEKRVFPRLHVDELVAATCTCRARAIGLFHAARLSVSARLYSLISDKSEKQINKSWARLWR